MKSEQEWCDWWDKAAMFQPPMEAMCKLIRAVREEQRSRDAEIAKKTPMVIEYDSIDARKAMDVHDQTRHSITYAILSQGDTP